VTRTTWQLLRSSAAHLVNLWICPFFAQIRLRELRSAYFWYIKDWMAYRSLPGSEPVPFLQTRPMLQDRTRTTAVDTHYFYQALWAFEAIRKSDPPYHVDVGSQALFVGLLSRTTTVDFVDIRPLDVHIANMRLVTGSILEMPYPDASCVSVSCLHVAEHVGLGRYGDPLVVDGTRRACSELSRVLAPGGDLYFSLPVGEPRTCFNAHRIHAPDAICKYFSDLELVSFGMVDDRGNYRPNVEIASARSAQYACGLFHFRRPRDGNGLTSPVDELRDNGTRQSDSSDSFR
jgi:SAM-dependent methyltransferase